MEISLIICAIVSFINLALVILLTKGCAINDQEIEKLKEDIVWVRKGKADISLVKELENKLFVDEYFDDVSSSVDVGRSIFNLISAINGTKAKIFKYDAVMFERIEGMSLRVIECYTSKENAIKHKEEIEEFKKKVGIIRKLNIK